MYPCVRFGYFYWILQVGVPKQVSFTLTYKVVPISWIHVF